MRRRGTLLALGFEADVGAPRAFRWHLVGDGEESKLTIRSHALPVPVFAATSGRLPQRREGAARRVLVLSLVPVELPTWWSPCAAGIRPLLRSLIQPHGGGGTHRLSAWVVRPVSHAGGCERPSRWARRESRVSTTQANAQPALPVHTPRRASVLSCGGMANAWRGVGHSSSLRRDTMPVNDCPASFAMGPITARLCSAPGGMCGSWSDT